MCKCKRCGDDFEIPEYTMVMAYTMYYKPCIIKALKAANKLSFHEYLEMTAKEIGKLKIL